MKKTAHSLLAVILVICLLMSGCLPNQRLDRRALVQALGFDRQGGEYLLTLQLFAGDEKEKEAVLVLQASGDSLSNALSELSVREGKQMFLGSLQVVVVGEQAAREGLLEFLEFLNGFHQVPPTLPIAVAQGTASELLQAGEKDPGASATTLQNLLQNAQESGDAPSSTLLETLGAITNGHVSATVPLLALPGKQVVERPATEGGTENTALEEMLGIAGSQAPEEELPPEEKPDQEQQEPSGVMIAGMGVFAGERMRLQMDLSASRGLSRLARGMKSAVYSMRSDAGGKFSVIAREFGVKIKPVVTGDSIVFEVTAQVQASIAEQSGSQQQNAQLIEGLLESRIRSEVEKAMILTSDQGLDPLGLSRYVRQQCPDFYRAHDNDWQNVLREAGFSVKVRVKVRQSGAAWRGIE